MDRAALNEALLEAHAGRDAARIAALFSEAGRQAEAGGALDEACFFWTQGYIWALEAGSPLAADLHGALKRNGREA